MEYIFRKGTILFFFCLVLLNSNAAFSQPARGLLFNEDFDGNTLHPNLVPVPFHQYRTTPLANGCLGGPGSLILTLNPFLFVGKPACPGVNWINKTDHTQILPGKAQSGRMLLVDVVVGSLQTSPTTVKKGDFTPVWRSPPVQVQESREYQFETYAINVMGSPNSLTRYQPNLQLWVTQSGQPDKLIRLMPVSQNLAGDPGTHVLYEGMNGIYEWKLIAGRISTLVSGAATFEIRARTDEESYNDFALDDISIYRTAVMTNVSVESTSPASGQILTRWTQPLEGISALQAPFEFRLYRASGQSVNQQFQHIFTTTDPGITSFTDQNLNTRDNTYIYKTEFYFTTAPGKLQLLETPAMASSVRLTAESNNTGIDLFWTYNVPWENSKRKHVIYREINGVFTAIDSIAAGPNGGQYTDRGTFNNQPLKIDKTYCYYIQTIGTFTNPGLPPLVRNNSQVFCVTLRDKIPPCPPALSVSPLNCDSVERTPLLPPFENKLRWKPVINGNCQNDIREFNLYVRLPESSDFEKIATTGNTVFIHKNLPAPTGCYAVTAVDSSGNESKFSNVVCQEVCFFVDLPNIITPNNDGLNDTFRPRQPAFIRRVNFSVYNRWGVKVYGKTTGPAIDWPGVSDNGNQLPGGIYYYLADIEFAGKDQGNTRKIFKGWVEVTR